MTENIDKPTIIHAKKTFPLTLQWCCTGRIHIIAAGIKVAYSAVT
jgi:hypothetical protein